MRVLASVAVLLISSVAAFAAGAPVRVSGEMDEGVGGIILMNTDNRSLYVYDKDALGKSNCNDACATDWPPLVVAADAQPDDSFTIVVRDDGTRMWAFKGHPLYLSRRDTRFTRNGAAIDPAWHLSAP